MAPARLHPLPLSSYPSLQENQVDCPEVGLSFHIIETGYAADKSRPLLLLLHGFPEIAYSWRKVMPALAEAGYYVVAPDQRGYGRTGDLDDAGHEKDDLDSFGMLRLVTDMIVLVHALGYHSVKCVVGHDFGAVVASLCALSRPDFFRSVMMMSHPFKGSPAVPFDTAHQERRSDALSPDHSPDIHEELAHLPEPRKHYKWYYSTPSANRDLLEPVEGLGRFLRAYFHTKSADWPQNDPHALRAWSAAELAQMPFYYIMPLQETMREAVARDMPSEEVIAGEGSRWLADPELDVYVHEWRRTGFQGGLNWYRSATAPSNARDLMILAGKKIEVPAMYVAGAKDWGTYQDPGAIEHCADSCSDFRGVKLIQDAGHWVQQEQPERLKDEMMQFLAHA
ncbi:MAG: hypothetical protein M1837_006491 [Sclerophora amabilis]|nr:MAG: hypothetical protein M1837_006491 [Sclerophora amabilis]